MQVKLQKELPVFSRLFRNFLDIADESAKTRTALLKRRCIACESNLEASLVARISETFSRLRLLTHQKLVSPDEGIIRLKVDRRGSHHIDRQLLTGPVQAQTVCRLQVSEKVFKFRLLGTKVTPDGSPQIKFLFRAVRDVTGNWQSPWNQTE